MMNAREKHFARLIFRLRVLEADGILYQRLFSTVRSYRDRGFIPTRPDGRHGDWKNDGYTPSSGIFYQVFAPERPEAPGADVAAAHKAVEDFKGLLEAWTLDPIREYRFAYNDKYHGVKPRIQEALKGISDEYGIPASPFIAKDLEDEALALPDDQLFAVLGSPVPPADYLSSVDFSVLAEVIRHIERTATPLSLAAQLGAPDFSHKIGFNGLSGSVAQLLTIGSYQTEAIRDYFSRNSGFARQDLRNQLASLYHSIRGEVAAHRLVANTADLVFFSLLERIAPPQAQRAASRQQAALVVMAHFFEACDIFEDPA